MCGILGAFSGEPSLRSKFSESLSTLKHRGPDGSSIATWTIAGSQLVFGHHRLAIIDLSHSADQPMSNNNGDTIIFNGEIYNYVELASELEQENLILSTASDTEVLLQSWKAWGTHAFEKFDGMFAFAIFDSQEKQLVLARDAFGIKPLYYIESEGEFFFGSEPKSLFGLTSSPLKINQRQAFEFAVSGTSDQGDETFFSQVLQLLPGHYLLFDLVNKTSRIRRWYRPHFRSPDYEISMEIRQSLEKSVEFNLRSDVPVALALSGGLDSTAICSLASANARSGGMSTFGYQSLSSKDNEKSWQDIASNYCGTQHVPVVSETPLTLSTLEEQVEILGEPFGSTSLIAQRAVFQSMRHHGFKVSIDGQGGDELFAGYSGYEEVKISTLILHGKFSELVQRFSENHIGKTQKLTLIFSAIYELLTLSHPKHFSVRFFRFLRTYFGNDRKFFLFPAINLILRSQKFFPTHRLSFQSTSLLAKRLSNEIWSTSLPALLKNADRNAMSNSVESRVPFLSPWVVRVALESAASKDSWAHGKKILLKSALKSKIPKLILNRTDKMGFRGEEIRIKNIDLNTSSKLVGYLHSFNWLKPLPTDYFKLRSESSDWSPFSFRLLTLALWVRVFWDGN
jgi:asparagine synthase (glutamine-hydrolysing)